MKNIIIEKSFKYKERNLKEINPNLIYKENLGFWVLESSNQPYMFSKKRQLPMTKKNDIETGEDQKGE